MLVPQLNNFEELEKGKVYSFVGFVNFLKIPNETLRKINWLADGILMSFLIKSLLGVKVNKYCFDFSGIADLVFSEATKKKLKLLVVGGTKEDQNKFHQILKKRYPNLTFKSLNGYQEIDDLEKLSPNQFDIAIYGLGAPLQEEIAIKYSDLFDYSFTCGAFISQTASFEGNYYPKWIVFLNLRWFYRLTNEPGHFRRVFLALVRFRSLVQKLMLRNF